jgi:hypothetical protein
MSTIKQIEFATRKELDEILAEVDSKDELEVRIGWVLIEVADLDPNEPGFWERYQAEAARAAFRLGPRRKI